MSALRFWVGALLLLGLTHGAEADVFRPAYLQLTEIDATTYEVFWRVPALNESTTLRLKPVFPAGATVVTPQHSSLLSGAAVQRWRMRIAGGLNGRAVMFPDLATTRIDVLVRLVRGDGTVQLARVLPVDPRFVVTASPSAFEVVKTYTVLGIEHILTGFDHLLFVLALLILVDGVRRLVATITAFTLAHSITLALASMGAIHVPAPPVEASIALSIVFVAGELMRARRGNPGITQRYPWIVAFTFGLLHGLGFAGALAEIGLPPLSIPTALLCFNVGVEIGQLLFITAVFSVVAVMRGIITRVSLQLPTWGWRIPPYVIGGMASYWVFERVAAF